MFDKRVTRFYPALNSTRDTAILSDMFVPDRIDSVNEYPQDFFQYVPGDWTSTLNGGTVGLIAGAGGILQIQSVVSNFATVQKLPAAWQMTKGLRAWYVSQIQVDSVLGLIIDGLLNVTATPFTGASQTDGMYFLSTNTGALSFNVAVGGVIASVNCGASLVPGAVANANLNFYYDGAVYQEAPQGRVVWEAWGPGVTANVRGEIVIPASGTIAAFPGATFITPTFGVSASTAAVRTFVIDKLYAAQDEVNPNATPAF